jgi:hypothetical protein
LLQRRKTLPPFEGIDRINGIRVSTRLCLHSSGAVWRKECATRGNSDEL